MDRIVNYSDLNLLKFEQKVFNKKWSTAAWWTIWASGHLGIWASSSSPGLKLDSLNAKFQLFKFRKYSINKPKEKSKKI
jgi:hypothetical protein